jgi:hypothetical protein
MWPKATCRLALSGYGQGLWAIGAPDLMPAVRGVGYVLREQGRVS